MMATVVQTNGIDFSNPSTDKPANLANSAVLRMLEEEERNRRGYPSQKKVVWPPVPETNGYHQTPQQQSPAFNNNAAQSPAPQQQYQAPPQPQYHNQPQYQQEQPHYQQQQQQQQQQQYQAPPSPQPQYQAPQADPSYCEGRRQEATGLSKLIPVGPGVSAAASSPYRPGPPSPGIAQPYRPQQSRWAPVPAPLSPQPQQGSQPKYPSQLSPQPYSPQPQFSPSLSEPAYSAPQKFEPPPATITLRQQPPVHQRPPPVFASQPATASYNALSDSEGGPNMRGDQKWPPQAVREAVAAENEARRQLARGPACRPRKVNKDYANFFAQHALNHNYPGYRAPPGTQHYEDNSGRSSY
ncbi:uncharacterized protein LOC142973709 isoform X7 [Anticarsia gemmatalis]|uniref:uncharacterized protein LOC142973709 isoform X7 n=1 Tax=Anticarsia gemmatalis TaxID=129554 RepID=UPI003F76172E